MANGTWITVLIRLTLGLAFLAHAVNKFKDYSGAVEGIAGRFTETWLPEVLVMAFAYVLPFWEMVVAAMLLLGLWYRGALVATGLLIALLTFGQVAQANAAGAAANLGYLIVILIGLRFVGENKWAVGR